MRKVFHLKLTILFFEIRQAFWVKVLYWLDKWLPHLEILLPLLMVNCVISRYVDDLP